MLSGHSACLVTSLAKFSRGTPMASRMALNGSVDTRSNRLFQEVHCVLQFPRQSPLSRLPAPQLATRKASVRVPGMPADRSCDGVGVHWQVSPAVRN